MGIWSGPHRNTIQRTQFMSRSAAHDPDYERLQKENEDLRKKAISLEQLLTSDKGCMSLLKLPTYATFVALLDYNQTSSMEYFCDIYNRFHCTRPGPPLKLNFAQELFLTFARYKSPLFNFDIVQRFGIYPMAFCQRFSGCGYSLYLLNYTHYLNRLILPVQLLTWTMSSKISVHKK